MKNLGLKVLSVLIAVMLAYFVHREGSTSEVGFVVPIEFTNVPPGKVVVNPEKAQAQVTVRGPSFLVAQIPLSPPVAKVSVPEDRTGVQRVRLSGDDFKFSPGVEIREISPLELEFALDTLASKSLPIVVPQIGAVSTGYVLEGLEVEPEKVLVTGPAAQLNGLRSVESEPIDLRGAQEGFTRELLLRNVNPWLTLQPARVTVVARVQATIQEKRLADVPVQLKGKLPPAMKLELTTVNVVVKGPREVVRDLRQGDVSASVEIPVKAQVGTELPVKVGVPNRTELVRAEPALIAIEGAEAKK